jgi:hypothetical protein
MHSALEIVAFSHNSKSTGVIALLQVALRALDEEGRGVIAVHVDMALALLKLEDAEQKVQSAAMCARRKEAVH